MRMTLRFGTVWLLVVMVGALHGCGDDNSAAPEDAGPVCPAVGRPPDGTPCSYAFALCFYDGEGDGRLVFTCPSGDCPDAPCNALFTQCGGQTFHHIDSTNCEGGI